MYFCYDCITFSKKMRRFVLCFFFLIFAFKAYSVPKNGIRAVWLTTAYGLDWPKTGAAGSKEEMDKILDSLAALDINTVMFQCRIRGDVAYRSGIEPMNRIFSGFDYDPLRYVVSACHKRGMECHAWIVCIPIGNDRNAKGYGDKSILRRHRNLLLKHKGQWYMNPSAKGTSAYISSIAGEIVSNYDVDGIHLDYIRYPDDYRNFPSRRWAMSPDASSERRRLITSIVASVSETVRRIKPDVIVSCATIGKYDDTYGYSSKGWNAYESLGQDVSEWFDKGYVDVIYPMAYFRDNDFYPFIADWKDRFGTEKVVPGIGVYKLDACEGNWSLGDLCRQLGFCRFLGYKNIGFYRAEYLVNNTKGLFYLLEGHDMLHMPSSERVTFACDSTVGKPENVRASLSDGILYISWNRPEGMSGKVRYVIYGSDRLPDGGEPELDLIDMDIEGCVYSYVPVYGSEHYRYFALTAVDEAGNESSPVYISMPYNKLRYKDFVDSGSYLLR